MNVRANNEAESKQDTIWSSAGAWSFHSFFARKGLLIFKPTDVEDKSFVTDKSFVLGSRRLTYGTKRIIGPTKSLYHMIRKLISESNSFNKFLDDVFRGYYFRRTIIDLIKQYLIVGDPSSECIFSEGKKQEVFQYINLYLSSLYICPWLSRGTSNPRLDGLTRFVTAGCIFGAGLEGEDQNGGLFDSVINHHIQFFPNQKIAKIYFDKEKSNAYEEYLLIEFNKLINFIKSINKKKKFEIYYHFPSYDYILFGIQLYIKGRITPGALGEFCKEIFKKKIHYSGIISAICQKNNINILMLSPFDNLFEHFNEERFQCSNAANHLFKYLQVELKNENSKANETAFVSYCLSELISKKTDCQKSKLLNQVWNDFLDMESVKENKPTTVDDLTEIANAVMVGVAAKGKKNLEVCSWLPVTEKQIQVKYAAKESTPENYPVVLNITYIDSVVSYAKENDINRESKSNGIFFYQNKQLALQGMFLNKWDWLLKDHDVSQLSDSDIVEKLKCSRFP